MMKPNPPISQLIFSLHNITFKMRFSNIIPLFFIFATLGLYMVSQITNSSTHYPLISLQPRRGLRTRHPDINKVDVHARRSNSMAKAYDANSNEAAEIVYNIDYHGVTTHPDPTPKHP